MSTLYNLEPQPTAKVLLQTTVGDILLELFAKQTPLASRNFLQLCLDGYYDNTIFHRLVPGFVIQGGDPTGTGSGGESSYDGEPFADEFHSRLKFNRRGLLGMANTGRKNDNGSQFFLTLDKAEELTGKNTMFGRVVGDTIYNLMKMGEAELADEGGERPLYPTKITGTEILVNPFEDMVRRVTTAPRSIQEKKDEKKKPKRKAGKTLLSFGADEGEEEVAHVVKKPKYNPKLVNVTEATSTSTSNGNTSKPSIDKHSASQVAEPISSTKAIKYNLNSAPAPSTRRAAAPSASPPSSPEPEKGPSLLERTNEQIAILKASMRRTALAASEPAPKKVSALEAMIPATATRGRKRRGGNSSSGVGAEEKKALDMFKAFKNRLDQLPEETLTNRKDSSVDYTQHGSTGQEKTNARFAGGPNVAEDSSEPAAEDDAALCDLHFIANCQSCTRWDVADAAGEEDEEAGWMAHALSFAKDRLGKDLEWKRKNEEELVVIDPREKARELKAERKGKREKERDGDGGKPKVEGRWEKEADKDRRRR